MGPTRRHSEEDKSSNLHRFHPFDPMWLHMRPIKRLNFFEEDYKSKGVVRGLETRQRPPSLQQLTETLEGLALTTKKPKYGAFNSQCQRPFVDWTRHVSSLSLDKTNIDLIGEGRLLKKVSKVYFNQVDELKEELELAVQKLRRAVPAEDVTKERTRVTRKRKLEAAELAELMEPNEKVVERVYVTLENQPQLQSASEPPTIEDPTFTENVTVEFSRDLGFEISPEIGTNGNLSETSQAVMLRRSGRLRKSAWESLKQLSSKLRPQDRTKWSKNWHLGVRRRAEGRRLTLSLDFSSAPDLLEFQSQPLENVQDFGTENAASSTEDEDEMVSIDPEGLEGPERCLNIDTNKPKSIQVPKPLVKDILRLKIESKSSGGAFLEVLRFVSERCGRARLLYDAYKDEGIKPLKIRLRQLASKDNAAYSAVPRLIFVNKDVKRLIDLDSAKLNAMVSAHIESDISVHDLSFEQANNEKGNFEEMSSSFFNLLLKEEQKARVAESVEASKRQGVRKSNDEFMDSGFSEESNFSQSQEDSNNNNTPSMSQSQGYFSQDNNDMELDDDNGNPVFGALKNVEIPATKLFEQLEAKNGEMGLHFMALLNQLSAKNISTNTQELNSGNAEKFFLSNGSRLEDFLLSGAEFSGSSIPLESLSLCTTQKGRLLVKKII